jgi:hypothetical protein
LLLKKKKNEKEEEEQEEGEGDEEARGGGGRSRRRRRMKGVVRDIEEVVQLRDEIHSNILSSHADAGQREMGPGLSEPHGCPLGAE